jgi:hypothetical protein
MIRSSNVREVLMMVRCRLVSKEPAASFFRIKEH